MSFEELGAWFVALNIQVAECGESDFKTESSAQSRNFAVTGGVAQAVNSLLNDKDKAQPYVINGLDKSGIRDLKKFAKNGKCELGDLIEVMACPGGCLGGSNTINSYRQASKQLGAYVEQSPQIKDIVK